LGAVATSDSRLTDTRTPTELSASPAATVGGAGKTVSLTINSAGQVTTAGEQAITPAAIGALSTSQLGAINGVASLGGDGKLNTAQLPALTSSQLSQITPISIGAVSTADIIGISKGGTGATTAEAALNALGGVSSLLLGATAGIAQLDNSGKLRTTQLPTITPATIGAVSTTDIISLAKGGTGATTAVAALAALGGVSSLLLGATSGIAELDSSGKLKTSQVPALTTAQIAQITPATIGAVSTSDVIAIAKGGTGATTATAALAALGGVSSALLGATAGIAQLDNSGKLRTTQLPTITPAAIGALSTADIISISQGGTGASTATGALLALGAAPLSSPAFTGTPTANTPIAGDNSTKLATTAFVFNNSGDRYKCTSTTSVTIGLGSKTFTVPTNLSYIATQDVTIVSDSNPSAYNMHGVVTSYSAGSLVVNVTEIASGSSGVTKSDWTINIGGLQVVSGGLQAANNLSDLANKAAALTNIGGVSTARTLTAGTGLTGGGDLTADRTISVAFGISGGTVCQGNDSRLSDTRTPTALSPSPAGASIGSANKVPVFTVNSAGQITTATLATITPSAIGALSTSAIIALSGGGTGATSQQGAINALTGTQTSGKYLRSDGTNATLSSLDVGDAAAGTLAVARGGTGKASYTAGQLLIGNNAGGLTATTLTAGTGVNIVSGDGAVTISATASSNSGGGYYVQYVAGSSFKAGTDIVTSLTNILESYTTAQLTVKLANSIAFSLPNVGDTILFTGQHVGGNLGGEYNGPWTMTTKGNGTTTKTIFQRPSWYANATEFQAGSVFIVTKGPDAGNFGSYPRWNFVGLKMGSVYLLQKDTPTTAPYTITIGATSTRFNLIALADETATIGVNAFTGTQYLAAGTADASVLPLVFDSNGVLSTAYVRVGAMEYDGTSLYFTPTSAGGRKKFAYLEGNTFTGTQILAPGTTTAAPLKFSAGANLSSAQAGNMEYDGTSLYFTPIGTIRKKFAYLESNTFTGTQIFAAGSSSAPPLKLTAGPTLTTPQAGALEFDGGSLYITTSAGSKKALAFSDALPVGGATTVSNIFTGTQTFAVGTVSMPTIKFQTGARLTTPQAGAVEYDGTNLYLTDSTATRKTFAFTDAVGFASKGANIFTDTQTLAIGTSAISPLKFQTGSLTTTPIGGAVEYDGTQLYLTGSSGLRKNLAFADSSNSYGNTDVYLSSSTTSGTINFDISSYNVLRLTSNLTGNITLSFTATGSTVDGKITLNSSKTYVCIFPLGASLFNLSGINIDGFTVSTANMKWLNGIGSGAIPAASINSVNVVSITILKTAANTYTIYGSFAKYL
jgi:hypothetical protein